MKRHTREFSRMQNRKHKQRVRKVYMNHVRTLDRQYAAEGLVPLAVDDPAWVGRSESTHMTWSRSKARSSRIRTSWDRVEHAKQERKETAEAIKQEQAQLLERWRESVFSSHGAVGVDQSEDPPADGASEWFAVVDAREDILPCAFGVGEPVMVVPEPEMDAPYIQEWTPEEFHARKRAFREFMGDRYCTCDYCADNWRCALSYDIYNTDGDCLYSK
jgi:hypothetical protein